MKLNREVILVTGANRGLGRALVEQALLAGVRRIYAGAREPERLAPVIALAPDRIVPLALDITSAGSLEAAAARALDVSLLVNNAGVVASHGLLTSSAEGIGQDFATNVFGTLAATKAFLPALRRAGARGEAAVVNVLSAVSLANMPALGGYSASKAAAASMTQALRSDLAPFNVRVHGVFAGAMETEMTRGMEVPKARPDDVARAILTAVESGIDDIFPDPMSQGMFETWRRDPKELERQLAGMRG